jgi:flagellar motility protein MotE (MotC chaperone)
MKALVFVLCLLCALLLSVLAALYASGRLNPPQSTVAADPAETDLRITIFPEQSRAVDDLIKANFARQEELERQEALLDEREAQIRQEAAALAGIRNELNQARDEINSYFNRLDAMAAGWDADERQNVRKLSEFYARMEPQNAARLLSEIEPDKAARLLTFLSDRQAGAIMDASVGLGPDGIDLAVKWTEIIRQLKKPQEDTK